MRWGCCLRSQWGILCQDVAQCCTVCLEPFPAASGFFRIAGTFFLMGKWKDTCDEPCLTVGALTQILGAWGLGDGRNKVQMPFCFMSLGANSRAANTRIGVELAPLILKCVSASVGRCLQLLFRGLGWMEEKKPHGSWISARQHLVTWPVKLF